MKKKYTIIIFVVSILLAATTGFFLGRSMVEEKEPVVTVKYIKGEHITDTIEKPVPYEIFKPIDTLSVIQNCIKKGIYSELFPEKTNIEYVVITKEDTSAIIQDWGTERLYHELIFDNDTIGMCEIEASVQYNRLSLIGYTYLPIQKEVSITKNKIKFFSPFIGVGLAYTHWSNEKDWLVNANVGFFIKEKYGLNLQYNSSWNFETNYIGASLLYKF
jgi:hypothetical protein